MSSNAFIIVVGAGIAGLTAAYQLRQAGHDVLVLESRDHVGGRMTTVEWEGFKVDAGAKFVAHRIFRWQDKVPTFRPGYLDALAAFWDDPQEGPVYFCGDYFAGPSAGGALYTGKECAGRVLAATKGKQG